MPENLPLNVWELALTVVVFLLLGAAGLVLTLLKAILAEIKRKDQVVTLKVVELAERLSWQEGYRAGVTECRRES